MKIFPYRLSFGVLAICGVLLPASAWSWGFFAHKIINRLAVFTLPPEMLTFYKHHIVFITENSVNPDRRRYAVEGEAEKHYLDADLYGDSAVYRLPRYWKDAVNKFTEDTLRKHGINPWWIHIMKSQLTNAMRARDARAILRISADLGHYIGDGNVPLHTTHNYNGQFTGQYGIHGFWESRLPELYAEDYNFFVGKAEYIDNTQLRAWRAITEAHTALDSVLGFEKELTQRFDPDKKYSYEERGGITVRVYSKPFSQAYHQMLSGQVECRMRKAIKMVGDFWYTSWMDAGQPDLNALLNHKPTEEELRKEQEEQQQWKDGQLEVRPESYYLRFQHEGHLCCCGNAFEVTQLLEKVQGFRPLVWEAWLSK